jgi:hypothetical protein
MLMCSVYPERGGTVQYCSLITQWHPTRWHAITAHSRISRVEGIAVLSGSVHSPLQRVKGEDTNLASGEIAT